MIEYKLVVNIKFYQNTNGKKVRPRRCQVHNISTLGTIAMLYTQLKQLSCLWISAPVTCIHTFISCAAFEVKSSVGKGD